MFNLQPEWVVGIGVGVAGLVALAMYLLGHKHAVVNVAAKIQGTVNDVAHAAADAVQSDVHVAVAGVAKVVGEVKAAVDTKPASQPKPVEQPKPAEVVLGDPPKPAPTADADKRQGAIDQAKAAYSEAKDRLGADHPDVKQGAGDVMKLTVAHAQAVAQGK